MKASITILLLCIGAIGQQNVIGRAIDEEIYNGINAVRGQFPYQVLLIFQTLSGGFAACGGSIISPQWILTAAHCSYQVNYTNVYTGVVNTADNNGVTMYTVTRANHFIHPLYNPLNYQNDIALLRLPRNITYTQFVTAIALPRRAQAPPTTFDNAMATASGFGKTQDNETGIHDILQFNTIRVFPHAQCVNTYRNTNFVTNGMICTDKMVVYAGPCQGDSGGPLTVNGTDSKPVVIGAVSWGVGNCSNKNPVVYTNVANYLTWINRVSRIPIS